MEITNEDNMALMARYGDDYFDLAFIDPEYGIGESSKNHKSRNTPVKQKNGKLLRCQNVDYGNKDWDVKRPAIDFFIEIFRVSKYQAIFGANYFEELMGESHKPPRRSVYKEYLLKHPKGIIIWDKVNGDNDFSDCEVIWTNLQFDSEIVYYMWSGMMQGKSIKHGTTQQGNKKLNEKRIHPTQKPVFIYIHIINFIKEHIDVSNVIDTGIGSGSSVIACDALGIQIIGCESDVDIYNSAINRIKVSRMQLKLF